MNFEEYKLEFTNAALNVGYSMINIKKCLDYAEPFFERKLPVIYNLSHLSNLVDYKKKYIERASLYSTGFYRSFSINKKNGSKRIISEPLPSLKEIQHWILDNIISKKNPSKYAKAYVEGVSLKQNLVFHRDKPKVYTIDLKDFFSSIKSHSIEDIFSEFGYSKSVAGTLAKLCCLNKSLPQGAPTSPALSNLYFKSADEEIAAYCRERKINYTRYADDMSFSGEFDDVQLLEFVRLVVNNLNLLINEDKKFIMKKNDRQIITGVVVNEKLQVPFYKRNKIRNEMFYIIKFGVDDHIKRKGISQSNYVKHLIGQINFILYLNPEDKEFQEYKTILVKIEKGEIPRIIKMKDK